VVLYFKKFVGLSSFLIVQSAAFAIIIYLTISGSTIKKYISTIPGLAGVSGLLINLALQFIDAVTPPLMQIITDFESWSSEFAVEIFLFRVYISATFNLLLVLVSYFLLADPYFLHRFSYIATNFRVGIAPATVSRCRLDQVSGELFGLFVNSIIIKLVILVMSGIKPLISAWISKKPWIKTEFEVQIGIISNANTAALCMVIFVFSPLSLLLTCLIMGAAIKIERYICVSLYAKSKRMWDNDKTAVIYTFFYLLSYTIIFFPTLVFFLSTKTFPKSCDIQDATPRVCLHPVLSNGICEVDSRSEYFSGYGSNNFMAGLGTSLCDNANLMDNQPTKLYPHCICYGDLACGSFIHSPDALHPFKDYVTNTFVLSDVWKWLVDKSYGAWILVFILVIYLGLTRNSNNVAKSSSYIKIVGLNSHIDVLELENRKLERFVSLLKQD